MAGVKDNGKYPHKSGDEATATKHGFYSIKKAISRKIDKRSAAGRALMRWRGDLISDLGGNDKVSVQQLTLIDLSAKNKLLLDSIDAWLFEQPTLVFKKKRSLLPVVKERQALADGLAKYLSMLGLERKTKIKSLAEILSEEPDEAEPQEQG